MEFRSEEAWGPPQVFLVGNIVARSSLEEKEAADDETRESSGIAGTAGAADAVTEGGASLEPCGQD